MEDFVKELEDGLMKTFSEVDENNLNGIGIDNTGRPTEEFKGTSFQDKINQTMNKLQNSSEQLDVCINIVNEILFYFLSSNVHNYIIIFFSYERLKLWKDQMTN
jgi:hypothetical protein